MTKSERVILTYNPHCRSIGRSLEVVSTKILFVRELNSLNRRI